MKRRALADGRLVTLHRNDGLRKRCGCPRRAWSTCPHGWHFSFKWKGTHHRFPIERYAEKPLPDRGTARDEADRLRILIRGGQFPPVPVTPIVATTPTALTFETFADKWITNARSQQSANQQANDKGIVKRLAALTLSDGGRVGDSPIGLLTVDEWEAAFRQVSGLAASTVNKIRQTILSLQEWGVDKQYLPRPGLAGKVLQKGGAMARRKGARRDRRLVADVVDTNGKITIPGEERRLMAVAGPWLQRLILAALETGCRRGELLALQWADVSLTRAQLTIRAETTKTRTMRQIPVSGRLLAVLKLIEHDPAGKPHKATAFVFGDAVGGQVKDPKKAWLKCCAAAGVTALHFHDLRHEAGSRMIEAGWPLHHVQKMLGHEDAKTTSIYLNASFAELTDSMQRRGSGGQPLHDLAQSADQERPPAVQQEGEAADQVTVN